MPVKLLRFCRLLVTPLEALNAPGGIHYLALTCEERVALAAHFNLQLLLGSACGKNVAAGTSDLGIEIKLRMNLFFHCYSAV